MSNREATEAFILDYIGQIDRSGSNTKLYQDLFAGWTDDQFHQFMVDVRDQRKHLVMIAPNFGAVKLTVENNFKIAESLGHQFFQRVWIGAKDGCPAYLSPVPYLVMDITLRRQSQLLTKKISVPEHNRTIDILSGQPTGASKGSKISFPELQVLLSMDLDASITEFMKYRGGDDRGRTAMEAMIQRYGTARMSTLEHFSSGVESTKSLKTYLTAAHIRSTL